MEVQHIFCVCQAGAEVALKAEVAACAPDLRFGFSRPGFVTFKLPEPMPIGAIDLPPLVFARARGVSLGNVRGGNASGTGNASGLVESLLALPKVEQFRALSVRSGLHVWQRETALPGAGGVEPCVTPLAAEVRSLIESAVKTIDHEPEAKPEPAGKPQPAGKPNDETNGAFVLDVALVEPNEWWVGCHQQRTRVDRWPGGVPAIELPDHAVSRAYLKMAEALRWSAVPAAKGELWVELGCAPGGASQALLDAGMLVLGVDPAEVARAVAADERFAHLRGRASDIKRRELTDARWLAADINAAPDYTLDAVESLVTHADAHFRGLLLTLKLPDWATGSPENLDRYAERVRGWGFRDVRMRQLAFNRREFCLAAMRSRGQRRLRR